MLLLKSKLLADVAIFPVLLGGTIFLILGLALVGVLIYAVVRVIRRKKREREPAETIDRNRGPER